MNTFPTFSGLLLVGLVCCAGCTSLPTESEAPSAWEQAQAKFEAQMSATNASLPALAAQQIGVVSQTTTDAFYQVIVFDETGMPGEAASAVRALHALEPNLDVHSVINLCCYGSGAVRVAALENFINDIANDDFRNNLDFGSESLIESVLSYLRETGETDTEIDAWLATRPDTPRGFWFKTRINFNHANGKDAQLIAELVAQVKHKPDDIVGARRLLDGVRTWRKHHETEKIPWDFSWMQQLCQPKLTSAAWALAWRLEDLGDNSTAAYFYRIACQVPFTDEDDRASNLDDVNQVQQLPPYTNFIKQWRANWTAGCCLEMAEILIKLQQPVEAEKWRAEATRIEKKYKLLEVLPSHAGEKEAESGQREIEQQLLKEGRKDGQDSKYWRKLAEYYRGRKDFIRLEEAFQHGLAVSKPEAISGHIHKGFGDDRCWFLSNYAQLLEGKGRTGEVTTLWRHELEQAPPSSAAAEMAAGYLAAHLRGNAGTDAESLWHWLGAQPAGHEGIIIELLQASPKDQWDAMIYRAEKLTEKQDPSRALYLGLFLIGEHDEQRALPLLKLATEKLEDLSLEARERLFNYYLEILDWCHAEEVASHLEQHRGRDWRVRDISRIAVAAAKAGDKADAVRLWRQVINLCPLEFEHLDELAQAGLKDDLARLYRDFARQLPTSQVPAKALKIIYAN